MVAIQSFKGPNQHTYLADTKNSMIIELGGYTSTN